jgi:hypothetical protein
MSKGRKIIKNTEAKKKQADKGKNESKFSPVSDHLIHF